MGIPIRGQIMIHRGRRWIMGKPYWQRPITGCGKHTRVAFDTLIRSRILSACLPNAYLA